MLFCQYSRVGGIMKVVTVGDNCMDVYGNLGKAFPGGNPVNVAVYLKRIGIESAYVGVVGNDDYGKLMIEAIREKGVDVSKIKVKTGKTAVTEVELNGTERVLGDYHEGVLEDFVLTSEEISFINTHQIVHSGLWGKVDRNYEDFKSAGVMTSFDFADRLSHELIEKTIPYVDYAFFSYTQDDLYIRAYLKKIHGLGTKVAIVTLGENGSIAFDGQDFYTEGIKNVEVTDTMGAGDSFIAGYISGITLGKGIKECMEIGTVEAAKTITYFGAW